MNRFAFGLMAMSALLFTSAHAQEADERTLTLEGSAHISRDVPLTIPFAGEVPPGSSVLVTQTDAGRQYPGTVRNNELTIVPDGSMPGAKHTYKILVVPTPRPPIVLIEKAEGKDALTVNIYDKPFVTYNYSNDGIHATNEMYKNLPQTDEEKQKFNAERAKHARKPFLWPVYSEGGIPVTRDWPMGEKELTADHPHQKSLWSSYGDVNGVDTWDEGPNSGYQHTDSVDFGSGDAYGWITTSITWHSKEGKPVLADDREYRFYASKESSRLFDLTLTFTAKYGEVVFGDTKEGGLLAFRIRDSINEKNGGVITLATGAVGMDDAWGKASPWSDYSGKVGVEGWRGIAVFDHPDNLRHPSRWHIRDYGLNGANVFGLSYFENDPTKNGDHTLKAGESITFKYRVYVHSGNVKDGKVEERFADYVSPPKIMWVD